MIRKPAILFTLLLFSACQPLLLRNNTPPQITKEVCPVSATDVLSCITASEQLSTQQLNAEFDTLLKALEVKLDNRNLSRLLCLSLHHNTSKEQLEKGKKILDSVLGNDKCRQQEIRGLLLLIQANIDLHKHYLNKNWKLYLEKKEIRNTKETIKQELIDEIGSYQRRIDDLEQQVKKLKDIESMLDK